MFYYEPEEVQPDSARSHLPALLRDSLQRHPKRISIKTVLLDQSPESPGHHEEVILSSHAIKVAPTRALNCRA